MGKKITLKESHLDAEWEKFVESSPDFSVYLTKEFLENTSENNKFFKCYKGEELRAAVVMVVDDENKKSISSNFLIYSGICYGQPTNNQSKSQQISERFELTSFILLTSPSISSL